MIAGSNCPTPSRAGSSPANRRLPRAMSTAASGSTTAPACASPAQPDDPAYRARRGPRILALRSRETFQAAGLPRVAPPCLIDAPQASSPRLAGHDAEKGPCIVSPRKGLTYHLRVGMAGDDALNLEATAETSHDHLHWFVDAAYLGVSEPSASPPLEAPTRQPRHPRRRRPRPRRFPLRDGDVGGVVAGAKF